VRNGYKTFPEERQHKRLGGVVEKIILKGILEEVVDGICLSQDKVQLYAVVNTVMNCQAL
jgi:hypothetical protein